MTRPRLALATFAVLSLGSAAGADAAEFVNALLAQAPTVPRGPGMYLNLLKFIPVVLIYLFFVRTYAGQIVDERAFIGANSAHDAFVVLARHFLDVLPVAAIGAGVPVASTRHRYRADRCRQRAASGRARPRHPDRRARRRKTSPVQR